MCVCMLLNNQLDHGPVKIFHYFRTESREMQNTTNRKQDHGFLSGFRFIFMRQIQSQQVSGTSHVTEEKKCRASGLCFTLKEFKNPLGGKTEST